jgi:uncharacterized protein (TIGR03083 family)
LTPGKSWEGAGVDNQQVLDKIDAAWQQLLSALLNVPVDRRDEPGPCGPWSIRDLLGHMAYWDRNAAHQAQRIAAGLKPDEGDWRAINEEEHQRSAGKAWDELDAEFHDSHSEMMGILSGLSVLDPEDLKFDTWEHYDEHRVDIERWLSGKVAATA